MRLAFHVASVDVGMEAKSQCQSSKRKSAKLESFAWLADPWQLRELTPSQGEPQRWASVPTSFCYVEYTRISDH